jgi:hypothetical protein
MLVSTTVVSTRSLRPGAILRSRAIRLVVELGRVAIHPVLDTLALLAAFQIRRPAIPSLQTDLNVEREAGLDTRIHPSHLRMDLVLVDDLARFQPAHYVRAPIRRKGSIPYC